VAEFAGDIFLEAGQMPLGCGKSEAHMIFFSPMSLARLVPIGSVCCLLGGVALPADFDLERRISFATRNPSDTGV
jgi:hypothetical protein